MHCCPPPCAEQQQHMGQHGHFTLRFQYVRLAQHLLVLEIEATMQICLLALLLLLAAWEPAARAALDARSLLSAPATSVGTIYSNGDLAWCDCLCCSQPPATAKHLAGRLRHLLACLLA